MLPGRKSHKNCPLAIGHGQIWPLYDTNRWCVRTPHRVSLQECSDTSNSETYRGLLQPRSDLHLCLPTTGRNEPLKKERPKWKSDYPMTEGQLRSKRDEFWDTAPAFEGRKEIWDALKAAAVALECNDHELAQAIVDGASITLPHGEDRRQVG